MKMEDAKKLWDYFTAGVPDDEEIDFYKFAKNYDLENRSDFDIVILFCYWYLFEKKGTTSFPGDIELEKGPEDLKNALLDYIEEQRKREQQLEQE